MSASRNRRAALAAIVIALGAAPGLAACGDDEGSEEADVTDTTGVDETTTPTTPEPEPEPEEESGGVTAPPVEPDAGHEGGGPDPGSEEGSRGGGGGGGKGGGAGGGGGGGSEPGDPTEAFEQFCQQNPRACS